MSATVLVVDDERANVALLQKLLIADGYRVAAVNTGCAALAAVKREHPDVVLLDVMMRDLNGFDVCRRLKSDPRTRLIPIVLLTALQETEDRIRGLDAGADDFLTKPFNVQELRARVRSLVRLKRYTDDLDSAESVIMSLALTIEARDAYTVGHCHRLARYATALGGQLGLKPDDLRALARGGVLHDLGKVGIPDGVLLKEGRLTAGEYSLMKQHTVIGDRLCGELRSLRRVRPIVRHHHERLDGSGYPDGLRGDAIPLLAQIIGIVDIFDALTTKRPYRSALSPEQAVEEILSEAVKGWRRVDLVTELVALVERGEFQPPTILPDPHDVVTKTV